MMMTGEICQRGTTNTCGVSQYKIAVLTSTALRRGTLGPLTRLVDVSSRPTLQSTDTNHLGVPSFKLSTTAADVAHAFPIFFFVTPLFIGGTVKE